MKRLILSLMMLSTISTTSLLAGVYRHDVPEEAFLNLAKQKQFDCVGIVHKSNHRGSSCVLIGKKYILTAAHTFDESVFNRETSTDENGKTAYNRKLIQFKTTDVSYVSFEFNGEIYKAKKMIIHPLYSDTNAYHTCDIALFELDREVFGIEPAKLNRKFDELNSQFVGVGYGASGPADKPKSVDFHNKKIAGENVVDSIGGNASHKSMLINGKEVYLFHDFDHPTDSLRNKIGSAIPMPLEYSSSGGDSGGGLFRKTKDGWELIGISTGTITDAMDFYNHGYYSGLGFDVRVSVLVDWIESQIGTKIDL